MHPKGPCDSVYPATEGRCSCDKSSQGLACRPRGRGHGPPTRPRGKHAEAGGTSRRQPARHHGKLSVRAFCMAMFHANGNVSRNVSTPCSTSWSQHQTQRDCCRTRSANPPQDRSTGHRKCRCWNGLLWPCGTSAPGNNCEVRERTQSRPDHELSANNTTGGLMHPTPVGWHLSPPAVTTPWLSCLAYTDRLGSPTHSPCPSLQERRMRRFQVNLTSNHHSPRRPACLRRRISPLCLEPSMLCAPLAV